MNKYAQLAQRHWQRTDPDRYAQIEDPRAFFTALGERAETEIQAMADSLAGMDQPGETYLEKVGRLNMARLRAEEAILSELVWIPAPEEIEEPANDWVTQTMREIHQADPDNEAPLD
ncbi:MAG: TnpV protein [Solirubrobacteraceae bacterium]